MRQVLFSYMKSRLVGSCNSLLGGPHNLLDCILILLLKQLAAKQFTYELRIISTFLFPIVAPHVLLSNSLVILLTTGHVVYASNI